MESVEQRIIEAMEKFNAHLRTEGDPLVKATQISQVTIVRGGQHKSEMAHVRTYDIRTTPPEVTG